MTKARTHYGLLAAALGVAALMAGPSLAATKFILAHPTPEDHVLHRVSIDFMARLDKSCTGMFEVEYHPAGELGDWTSQFEQAKNGAIEMTMTYGFSEFDPRLDLSFLGYVVDDWATGQKAFGPDGPMVPVYADIFAELNMHLLGTIPGGFYGVSMRKGDGRVPTHFPADGKGIKIRVPPVEIGIKRFEALGFSPVPMPWSELYTALQMGTIDARAFGPPAEVWIMRDVLETFVFTRDAFEHAFWVVNQDWWQGLSEDQRTCMTQAANESLKVTWADAEAHEQEDLAKIKKYGIKVVDLTPEEMAKAKQLVYDKEWTWMEQQVGKELMDKVKAAAGRK